MPEKKINIVIIVGSKVQADLITAFLDTNLYSTYFIDNGLKAFEYLTSPSSKAEILIIGYHLAGLNGIELIRKLNETGLIFGIIFISSDTDIKMPIEAIRAGAHDFLYTGNDLKSELPETIHKVIGIYYESIRRKRAEEIIIQREQDLRILYENAPLPYQSLDANGCFLAINEEWLKETGYSKEDVLGRSFGDFMTPDSKEKFNVNFPKLKLSGSVSKIEFELIKKDKSLIYISLDGRVSYDENHQFIRSNCIWTNISQQHKLELNLKESEEKYFSLFNNNHAVMLVIEPRTGNITDANQAACNFYKYTREELIALNISQINTLSFNEILESMAEAREMKRNFFIFKHKLSDDEVHDVEVYSGPIALNGKQYLYSIVHDITDKLTAEQKLKESEKRFRTIFETANAGIAFTASEGNIISANNVFSNLLGYSQEELKLMKIDQLTHPDDFQVELNFIDEIKQNKRDYYRLEKRYLTKDSRIIWVDIAVSVIRLNGLNEMYFIKVVNDITQRKVYENSLEEANAAKNTFFTILAHDLRGPLSSIIGLIEILINNFSKYTEDKRLEYLNGIYDSIKNTFDLMENLLEWTKSQTGRLEFNPQHFNLEKLIYEVYLVLKEAAKKKNIKLKLDIPKDYKIVADRNMINTVLRNFVSNAIKFTPEGGAVKITFSEDLNVFRIGVSDTGVGINKEDQEKLFRIDTKFYTSGTNEELGSGLGLLLCKEFIEKHGGFISVESEPGQGSTFCFTIPKII